MIVSNSLQFKSIGKLLKDERMASELTIAQVAEATKIRPMLIEALENGNYTVFDSDVYAKGLLKNYAKFLDLDVEHIIALYRREVENKAKVSLRLNEPVTQATNWEGAFSQRNIYIAIGVLIIFLFGWYFISQISAVLRPPALQVTSPLSASAAEAQQSYDYTTDKDRIEIDGKTSAQSIVTINGTIVATNSTDEFHSAEIPLPNEVNKIKISATNQFGREAILILNVHHVAPPITSFSTQIKILGSMHVLVKVDGDTVIDKVLRKDETFQFTCKSELQLQVPDPSKINLTVDDEAKQIITGTNIWNLQNNKIEFHSN